MPEKTPFRLFKRKNQKFYYARYLMPDGTYTAGRTTKQTTRKRAEAVAWEHCKAGKISAAAFTTIEDMARRETDPETGEIRCHFFDWDGEHTLNKRSAGKRISRQQCGRYNEILERHIVKHLGGVRLQDIDTRTVRRFRNTLFKEGYSGSTINKILGCLKALINAADEMHLIRYNVRIERAAIKNKARGVLTQAEVQRLFAEPWSTDPRAYAASMLSAAAGLRLGEIQGLHIEDIEPGRVTVRGVWSDSIGGYRPGTKNGQETRSVPIPETVSTAIQKCISMNPWGDDPQEYVFFSTTKPGRPANDTVLTEPFYKALAKIGIKEEERKARNIVFHSHRHFFNSMLIESRIPIEKIQRLTGHLSKSMTEHYYHPGEMEDVARVQRRLFKVVKGGKTA
ncbi:tyrosine-type recombinase/integrase [Marispirochaeta sp.]|uniref:tyrosine-type recombinase/integrase n=1 Tax=Marispirochaeta sp. TaxID=2038653 RepID=UPI0029C91CA1|nr:tyrosine-type recombinase/integrase [Marispirochaeta sp.]